MKKFIEFVIIFFVLMVDAGLSVSNHLSFFDSSFILFSGVGLGLWVGKEMLYNWAKKKDLN